jgi:hypothetical protein
MWRSICLDPLLVQVVAATCACESDLAIVNRELTTVKAAELRATLTQPKKGSETAMATVNASSGLVGEDRRRLSHGSAHYAAVPALQVHEFPNGGSYDARGANTSPLGASN